MKIKEWEVVKGQLLFLRFYSSRARLSVKKGIYKI